MDEGKKTETEKGEELVYRYSRARRLERASESAQWLASRARARKPGILGSLLATRASRILFFTILGLTFYFLALPLFDSGAKRSGNLGEARYSATALYYEGRVLVALVRKGGARSADGIDSIMVVAQAEGSGPENPLARFEFPIGDGQREEYRLAVAAGLRKPERLRITIVGSGGSLLLLLPVD